MDYGLVFFLVSWHCDNIVDACNLLMINKDTYYKYRTSIVDKFTIVRHYTPETRGYIIPKVGLHRENGLPAYICEETGRRWYFRFGKRTNKDGTNFFL